MVVGNEGGTGVVPGPTGTNTVGVVGGTNVLNSHGTVG